MAWSTPIYKKLPSYATDLTSLAKYLSRSLWNCSIVPTWSTLTSSLYCSSLTDVTRRHCPTSSTGGVFSTDSNYGTIELSHFSGVGIGRKKEKGKGEGRGRKGEEGEKRYSAHTFYMCQAATTWLMHFMIVCDL